MMKKKMKDPVVQFANDRTGGPDMSLPLLLNELQRCADLHLVFDPTSHPDSKSTQPLEKIAQELAQLATSIANLVCDIKAESHEDVHTKLDIAMVLLETKGLTLPNSVYAKLMRSAKQDLTDIQEKV